MNKPKHDRQIVHCGECVFFQHGGKKNSICGECRYDPPGIIAHSTDEKGWCGKGRLPNPHDKGRAWFYQTLGWAIAEACAMVDLGVDIRKRGVPDIVAKAEIELRVPWKGGELQESE